MCTNSFILSSSLPHAWWLQLEDGDFRAYTCKKFLITVDRKMATAKRLWLFFFNLWELFSSSLIWNFYKHFFCALAHPVHFRNLPRSSEEKSFDCSLICPVCIPLREETLGHKGGYVAELADDAWSKGLIENLWLKKLCNPWPLLCLWGLSRFSC